MSVASCISARDSMNAILDPNSFVEIGGMILGKLIEPSSNGMNVIGDGVITGYGLIQSNPVYIYCQDSSTLGGTIGEMHAKKIAHMYDLALKVGAPIIGIIDSAGLRLQESTDGMQGLGEIYQKKVLASGVIPQITIVLGNCGGGLAVLASLSDFTFVVKNRGSIFMNSPNVFTYDEMDKIHISSPEYNNSNGRIDFLLDSEKQLTDKVRELVTMIPASNDDKTIMEETTDNLNRMLESFKEKSADLRIAIKEIADQGYFLEVKDMFAREMVIGYIKLNGLTIGVIGNSQKDYDSNGDELVYGSELTAKGCKKASEFIKFCNAFNIPILTLTSVTGYSRKKEDEETLAVDIAKLTYQFSHATVPKVNLIIGDSYGSAYIAMNSKHIGADLVYSLADIHIGTMEVKAVGKILKHRGLSIQEIEAVYEEENKVVSSANKGYVDVIIPAESVRKHLIYAFDMLYTKREHRPRKKHGTV